MSRVYISICLCHLQFPSLMFYGFQGKYKSFNSLVRFIPRCFTLCDTIVNDIVFLISLSHTLLLVYRNETHTYWIYYFCILQIYQIHQCVLAVSCGIFRIFCVYYHVICKQGQFYFLLSNLDPVYFFFLSDCCD